MRVALHLAVLTALVGSACKKTSPTDLSTPEKTLESFFNAVNESRIPDEAVDFVIDDAERTSWKLRCETRGCKKSVYKILEIKEVGERGATLIVDYQVYGKKNQIVMRGKASSIRFERHNSKWGIVQFGERHGAKSVPKVDPSPGAPL